jgi:hypothetical protein
MDNRWCIIGTPRSGSTRLENSILEHMPNYPDAKKIQIAEFLHANWMTYYEYKSDVPAIVQANDWSTPERLEFYHDMLDKMENSNDGFTLRIFPQAHILDHNYAEILKKLEECKFNFVKLTRNLFDRVISLCVAQSSDIWHRMYSENQNIKFAGGPATSTYSSTNKVFITTKMFVSNYIEMKTVDFFLDEVTTNFKCINVAYETMDQDCVRYNVPYSSRTHYLKTYDEPYSNIIKNYQELTDLYIKLNNFFKA